jgi:hypothetical protein
MSDLYGKIDVKIRGITPLLMNRLDVESLAIKIKPINRGYDAKAEARKSAYMTTIDGKEQLYVPCEAIYSMILGASQRFHDQKRTSIARILAGSIRVEPEKILLGTDKYEIDLRAVRNLNYRIPKARAKIPEWSLAFQIVYYKPIVNGVVLDHLENAIQEGGRLKGLLDYRPEHKGWFGTFELQEFKIQEVPPEPKKEGI